MLARTRTVVSPCPAQCVSETQGRNQLYYEQEHDDKLPPHAALGIRHEEVAQILDEDVVLACQFW